MSFKTNDPNEDALTAASAMLVLKACGFKDKQINEDIKDAFGIEADAADISPALNANMKKLLGFDRRGR